jgi:hypothetical protein
MAVCAVNCVDSAAKKFGRLQLTKKSGHVTSPRWATLRIQQ